MTFLEQLLMGGAPMCYAPADDGGGAGGGSDDGAADDAGDSGDNDAGGGDDGGNDSGDSGDDGKKKTGDSMLDALDDGDGVSFDFSGDEKPEGFPDEYWDAENGGVNAQALFDGLKKQEKIAKDLREKMGKGQHKAPEKPDDYKLELSEELQALVPSDDPLMAKARQRAHEHGMSQEAFQGFISEIIADMAELATGESPESAEAAEAKRKEYIQNEIKAIGPNGPQVLRAVESWGKELLAEGTINEGDLETMVNEGLVSAKMVQLFNRLRSRMGGSEIPLNPIDDGLPPDSEIAETINAAYESKNEAKIKKAEELLDKRRAAGRPEKLQF